MQNVSKYSFAASIPMTAQPTDTEKKGAVSPSQKLQQGDVFVQKKKNDNRQGQNFWQRNSAAIMGITSIGFLAFLILSSIINRRAAGKENIQTLDKALTHNDVFKNYKDNKNIPTLDTLPGMAAVKKSFRERIINPKVNSALSEHWGADKANGVLLYGPPGTGKTFATKVLAKSLNAEVAEISIQEEGSAFINQAAKNIGNKFDFIYKAAEQNPDKEFVVIMEEIDGIAKARGGYHSDTTHIEVVNTLLTCFDKAKKYKNITIVANTNNDHLLDSAIKDRLPVRIEIGLPDKETIKAILDYKLQGIKASKDFVADDSIIQGLVGFSNRKIEQITQLALSKGASGNMQNAQQDKLTKKLFMEAIDEIRKTDVEKILLHKNRLLSGLFNRG